MKRRAVVLAAALLLGCSASSPSRGPSDTLRAYARALEEGRVDDAYRLLSDEAKRSMSLEAFRRSVRESPADALEIARALARPATDPVVTATVTMPNGEELVLVLEGDVWRIDGAQVDLYGQTTPRQALLGFLRAYERKRYDVILRYVPDAEKEGLGPANDPDTPREADRAAAPPDSPPRRAPTPERPPPAAPAKGDDASRLTAEKLKAAWESQKEIDGIVRAIRTALPSATIEEAGDSASMVYGGDRRVSFVREHGV